MINSHCRRRLLWMVPNSIAEFWGEHSMWASFCMQRVGTVLKLLEHVFTSF